MLLLADCMIKKVFQTKTGFIMIARMSYEFSEVSYGLGFLGFFFNCNNFFVSSASSIVDSLIHNQRPSCNCLVFSINEQALELNVSCVERAFPISFFPALSKR